MGERLRSCPPNAQCQQLCFGVSHLQVGSCYPAVTFVFPLARSGVVFVCENLVDEGTHYSQILNSSTSTPFTFRLFDGRTLVVRDHVVPCDDLYCYVNNWYDLPRAEVVKNFTFFEEVSDKWCKHLEEIVPNIFGISMARPFERDFGHRIILSRFAEGWLHFKGMYLSGW